MLMNGGATINYGRRNARPAQHGPPAEPVLDYGTLNVDAMLRDHEERRWTQALTGKPAQQALNALQKWMFEHDADSSEHGRENWRHAYNVMTKLAYGSNLLPEQLNVSWVAFAPGGSVARGAFAEVHRGENWHRQPIAIKRLQPSGHDAGDLYRRFKREALIWFQLRHPNILPLQGIYQQTANMMFYQCMISPWVDGGTIFQYIRSGAHDPATQRVPLLKDVAKGLDYVHQRHVYHGDLHDNNILIYHGHAVLTDFGMTVVGDTSQSRIPTTQIPAHAIRWLAPELIDQDSYTPRKSSEGDIFAFGRLCMAICTKGVIYENAPEQAVAIHVAMGTMPDRPSTRACYGVPMSDQLWNLAVACWNLEPPSRPTAAQALQFLRT